MENGDKNRKNKEANGIKRKKRMEKGGQIEVKKMFSYFPEK